MLRQLVHRMRRVLADQNGATYLEIGVYVMLVLLFLVGFYVWFGPQLKSWLQGNVNSVFSGTGR